MIELKINGNAVKLDEEQEKVLLGYLKPKSKRWKPEDGNRYFSVFNGDLGGYFWAGDSIDNWCYSQRNVFKTHEEAAAHKRYLEAVARLRDSSDFVPKAEDDYYVVRYSIKNHRLEETVIYGSYLYSDLVKYKTEELAEQSIKENKEDWLLYFGVKDES